MEKIIVIALLVVNVQLVVASCSSETATACLDAYSACSIAAANTTEAACTCYGFYLRCLLDSACITDSEYQNIVQTCTDSGCTRQQCLGGIDAPVTAPVSAPVAAPVTFTPVPSSGCDYAVADACLSTYLSCVGSGSQEEICNCYGPYIYCYFYGAGCLTLDQYEEAVQYCVQFNCSVQQCNSGVSGPISSTPVQAPVQSPFPSTPVSSCDYNTIIPCQDRFVNCTNEAQSSSEICDCYGPYYNCVYDTGCISSSDYWNAVNYCQESGCTIEQCTANSTVVPPPVETPVTAPYATPYSEPIDNSTCAQSAVMTCYNKYESCLNASSNFCDCYGPYLYCLYEIQCFNSTGYEQNVDSCIQYGCSYQQCANTGFTPVQAPVQAPSPIEVPSSSQCNSQSATFCANEYNSCVLSAGTNISDICSCYGPYFGCLLDIDCLTPSQYQSLIQTCAQSGCTLQQCGGTVGTPVTTPFQAPTASTPIGPTPTSTTPVSAPFSAPSTVICLQPWELVLIVVGSVLAGVGIAAIIGVIIYLSRGRSGVKKTNKYAKLQRY